MYELKEGKNNYQLIVCSTSIDLHTGEYVPSARSRIGGSYDKPDFGHLVKFIYEFDDISMLLPTPEPGVDSPYEDFVFHPVLAWCRRQTGRQALLRMTSLRR